MRPELIITNGDSTAQLMQAAGFIAEILPWRDVLLDGPVPDLPPAELVKVRSKFLADYGDVSAETIAASLISRDKTIANLDRFESIALWFEHDLYDQLQLIQILAQIAALSASAPVDSIQIVQADTYLSDYTPDTIADLRDKARPIVRDDLVYAQSVWRDFTGIDPTALNAHIKKKASLPFVPVALRRLALEFPDSKTGLSLTETRILQILAREPELAGALFGKVGRLESARFMGDLSFAACLDTLAFGPNPLVSGLGNRLLGHLDTYEMYFTSGLAITSVGQDVLAGHKNHVTLNGVDRWIGGAHVTPSSLWVWDGSQIIQGQI